MITSTSRVCVGCTAFYANVRHGNTERSVYYRTHLRTKMMKSIICREIKEQDGGEGLETFRVIKVLSEK